MPQAIVFLGAQDEEYAAEWQQEQAMDYLAGLSNILISAEQSGTGRFVYLSSTQVYGAEWSSKLDESAAKNPQDMRCLMISEGEDICQDFAYLNKMECVVLRLTEVFGLASPFDFCSRLFLEAALTENLDDFYPPVDMMFNPLYLSDAVDAVFKAITPHKAPGTFNVIGHHIFLSQFYSVIAALVKGSAHLSDEALAAMEGVELAIPAYEPESEGAEIAIEDLLSLDESKETRNNSIIVERTYDGSTFSQIYGYRAIIDINVGLKRTYGSMKRRIEGISKAEARKKHKFSFLAPLFPYLETLAAFLFFAFLQTWVPEKIPSLAGFDFILLAVVIVAIMLGGVQPVLAVMLSGVYMFWLNTLDGRPFLDTMLDIAVVLRILQLLIIGTICGYARDHMRAVMHEKTLEVSDLNNELVTIYRINAANTQIKKMLDEKLAGYDDSLAKMFLITDRLNALNPEKVFFEAVETVSDMMQCFDVSIYAVTGGDFKMCRLIARTPSSDRTYKISVALNELGGLKEVIIRDEVFANRTMEPDLPMLAAPVFYEQELMSIIMLWDLPFEKVSLYHMNRFLTLSRLIASSLGRAYAYTADIRDLAYVPGTEILTHDAFMDKLKIFNEALEKDAAQFMTIIVSPAKTRKSLSNAELSASLRPLLRTNDYIGEVKDSPDSLYVLLSNTDKDSLGFVLDRLGGVGLTGQEVRL
jgi:nucleoside-diphosphate-sugar epimerase